MYADASYKDQGILANHRTDAGKDIYYLYNYAGTDHYYEIHDAKAADCDVTLKGTGTPYLFDAWTGTVTPVEDYESTDDAVTLHVNIAPNDTAIIVLSDEELVAAQDEAEAMSGEVTLDGWNLKVASWVAGESVLDIVQEEHEVGALDTLDAWNTYEGLENASGVGTYTTTFELADGYSEGQRVYIHLGHVKDAYGLTINGSQVAIDQSSGTAEITDYVHEGENEVEIRVATSMLNAILKSNEGILNDDGRVLDDRAPSAYGLTDTVVVNGSNV